MSYFCYIHRAAGGVPHFEVLPESSRDDAIDRAANILAQRADALRADVWQDERLIFSLPHAETALDHAVGPSLTKSVSG